MADKKKVLVFYKQMNEQYCRAISALGLEPISFFDEEKKMESFRVTFWLKYLNIFRRIFFGDKQFLDRAYRKHLNKNLIRAMKSISEKHKKIDYILFFRADYYPQEVIDKCKQISNKMVSYQFDGMDICQSLLPNKDKFDKIFTFDRGDLEQYGFEPLTNCWFPDEEKDEKSTQYDIFYVGVGTPDRIEKAKRLRDYSLENNIDLDLLLTVNQFVKSEKEGGVNLSHTGISYEENLERMKSSKAILDMKLFHHNGLSYRFFEALYYQKKIITDNIHIRNYDFYHPDNVFITDYQDFSGLKDFLDRPYQSISPEIVKKYGVENWLRYVLDIEPYQKIELPPLWKL